MNERPAYWGIGLGLGLALAGGFVVADAYAGLLRPGWWALYPALVLSGMGTVVTLAGVGKGLAWVLVEWDEMQARRNPPAPEPEYAPEPDDSGPDVWQALEDDWAVALRVFFRNGDVAGGFSHSRLVELGKSMSEGDWTALTEFYAGEAGGGVLRLDSKDGYVRGHGWSHDYIMQCITRRTLPHPDGEPPRVVAITLDTTRHPARRQPATARAEVVDIA